MLSVTCFAYGTMRVYWYRLYSQPERGLNWLRSISGGVAEGAAFVLTREATGGIARVGAV